METFANEQQSYCRANAYANEFFLLLCHLEQIGKSY